MRIPSILVLLFWSSVLAQSLVIPRDSVELVKRSEHSDPKGKGKATASLTSQELRDEHDRQNQILEAKFAAQDAEKEKGPSYDERANHAYVNALDGIDPPPEFQRQKNPKSPIGPGPRPLGQSIRKASKSTANLFKTFKTAASKSTASLFKPGSSEQGSEPIPPLPKRRSQWSLDQEHAASSSHVRAPSPSGSPSNQPNKSKIRSWAGNFFGKGRGK